MDPKNIEETKLDPTVSKQIKELIEKDLSALTQDDKDFLRARKSYLGRSSRQKFADVLNEKPEVKKESKPKDAPKEKPKDDQTDTSQHPADTEEETEQAEDDNVE